MTVKNILYWPPRILSIFIIAFISMVTLDIITDRLQIIMHTGCM